MTNWVPSNIYKIPKEAKLVFKGVIFDVYQWQQKMFDGSYETFEKLRRPYTADIIPVVGDKIITIQESHPDHTRPIAIPGGMIDKGESPLQAAKREAREEIGMEFASYRLVSVVQPVSRIDWLIYTFLATDKTADVNASPDNGENIVIKELDFSEVKKHSVGNQYLAQNVFTNLDSLQALLDLKEFEIN